MGLDIAAPVIEQLCDYLGELQKWNKRINLVANAPQEILIETHFLDSLTLLPLIANCPDPGLMDIGSGAGFPGLVLKIAAPQLAVSLVEPRQKRTAFMRQVIRNLGLEKVTVLETRLEKDNAALAAYHNRIPLLTSRAFASIDLFLKLAEPLCAPGGKLICMKGPKADAEIAEWRSTSAAASPFQLSKTSELTLPLSGAARKILIFTKD